MENTRKPTAAGILTIITGVSGGLFGLAYLLDTTGGSARSGGIAICFGIIAIIGGVFALRRRIFWLASTGAYFALLCGLMAWTAAIIDEARYHSGLTGGTFALLVFFGVLGILAIVLTHLGKGEFR
jgi:lysylphosphatidylglycerol synthetase-like protein (DUF2156 family)